MRRTYEKCTNWARQLLQRHSFDRPGAFRYFFFYNFRYLQSYVLGKVPKGVTSSHTPCEYLHTHWPSLVDCGSRRYRNRGLAFNQRLEAVNRPGRIQPHRKV